MQTILCSLHTLKKGSHCLQCSSCAILSWGHSNPSQTPQAIFGTISLSDFVLFCCVNPGLWQQQPALSQLCWIMWAGGVCINLRFKGLDIYKVRNGRSVLVAMCGICDVLWSLWVILSKYRFIIASLKCHHEVWKKKCIHLFIAFIILYYTR